MNQLLCWPFQQHLLYNPSHMERPVCTLHHFLAAVWTSEWCVAEFFAGCVDPPNGGICVNSMLYVQQLPPELPSSADSEQFCVILHLLPLPPVKQQRDQLARAGGGSGGSALGSAANLWGLNYSPHLLPRGSTESALLHIGFWSRIQSAEFGSADRFTWVQSGLIAVYGQLVCCNFDVTGELLWGVRQE